MERKITFSIILCILLVLVANFTFASVQISYAKKYEFSIINISEPIDEIKIVKCIKLDAPTQVSEELVNGTQKVELFTPETDDLSFDYDREKYYVEQEIVYEYRYGENSNNLRFDHKLNNIDTLRNQTGDYSIDESDIKCFRKISYEAYQIMEVYEERDISEIKGGTFKYVIDGDINNVLKNDQKSYEDSTKYLGILMKNSNGNYKSFVTKDIDMNLVDTLSDIKTLKIDYNSGKVYHQRHDRHDGDAVMQGIAIIMILALITSFVKYGIARIMKIDSSVTVFFTCLIIDYLEYGVFYITTFHKIKEIKDAICLSIPYLIAMILIQYGAYRFLIKDSDQKILKKFSIISNIIIYIIILLPMCVLKGWLY